MKGYRFDTQRVVLRFMAKHSDRAMQACDLSQHIGSLIDVPATDYAAHVVLEKRIAAAFTCLRRKGLIEREEPGWYAVTLRGVEVAR